MYRTINLINEKYYIGVHSTYNLEDGYLGSGKRLKRAVEKYGKENFKCEILEFFESREEVLKREKEIVNENLLNDINCMNIQPGGGGGIFSKEHHLKMIKGSTKWIKEKWNDVEFRKKQSEFKRERGKSEEGKKLILSVRCDWTGKKHSPKTIEKMKKSKNRGELNSQYGTCWINNGLENKKIKKEHIESFLKEGWIQGRMIS